MSELAEDTRRVTLLLGDNPEGKTQWHTCLDLSHNEYAIQKLRETGRLEAGKATSLTVGQLQNLLTKAQKDAHGFQDTPASKCLRGSEPERRLQAYKFAENLNRALCEGSPVFVRSLSRGWTYLSRVSRTDHNWEGIQTDKPDRRR